jgi:simple sugar transport system permease protein
VNVLRKFEGNLFLAFLIAGCIGIALGAVNAYIISSFSIPTLIVTLGTSNVFFGLLLSTVKHTQIQASYVPRYLPDLGKKVLFTVIGKTGLTSGFSYLTIIMIIVFIVTWALLRYTSLGRNIYAIGGSMEAARRSGISIVKTQFFIYCYSGFLAGTASMLNVALVRYVNPFNIMALLIDVIAAVVLGGARIAGGAGTVLGTLLGVIMIFFIRNSLILMKVSSYWHSVIIGLIIIISMTITVYRKGRGRIVV